MNILNGLRNWFGKKPKPPINPGDYEWTFNFVQGGFCELKKLRQKQSFGHPPLSDKGESRQYFAENGICVDYGGCEHDFKFDPKYSGYCPQPKECTKCGFYDYNGFTGSVL